MTQVNIHGILGVEYGKSFYMKVGNSRNVLKAIDCNKDGFIKRLIALQQEGSMYDIIINKKRITKGEEINAFKNPARIDIVPTICGRGGGAAVAIFKAVAMAAISAAISYALTPKQEATALEVTASANRQSYIFSNVANVASQGTPMPLGYGRLKVGSQVIQASIKSFPQYQKVNEALSLRAGGIDLNDPSSRIVTSEV